MAETVVTIRPRVWESERFAPTTTVTLTPAKFDGTWEVRHDGRLLGRVVRYTGSHDRKIAGTRLRSAGRRRTLWAATTPNGHTDYWREHDTRADAIRVLLNTAGLR